MVIFYVKKYKYIHSLNCARFFFTDSHWGSFLWTYRMRGSSTKPVCVRLGHWLYFLRNTKSAFDIYLCRAPWMTLLVFWLLLKRYFVQRKTESTAVHAFADLGAARRTTLACHRRWRSGWLRCRPGLSTSTRLPSASISASTSSPARPRELFWSCTKLRTKGAIHRTQGKIRYLQVQKLKITIFISSRTACWTLAGRCCLSALAWQPALRRKSR